jgi:uncharacterized protein
LIRAILVSLAVAASALAQAPPAPAAAPPPAPGPAPVSFDEYNPKSTLVVPEHPRTRAKFPFIDVHNHQRNAADVAKLVADMDRINMAVMVNLSAGSGPSLEQNVAKLQRPRFVHFANIDLRAIDEPDFGAKAARQLEEDVKNGAAGPTGR